MKIQNILKWYLLISSIYLIGDGIVHLLDIKLIDANLWPEPSLVYSKFIGHLFGAFAILASLLGLESQRDLKKYKNVLYIVAIWSLFYGSYLVYTSLTVPFSKIFSSSPSVFVWMPFYNYYLVFEASLLFTFSLLVFLWRRNENN